MGIPKFYRWLSERYPLVNQPGGATVVPVIDNFYLDMNGIVHNCTHGNDPDTKLTEEEMIKKIFMYLDKLFHIVKPQKLMFMAIDGVAPRAKMNQQRARRFKTAREAAQRAAESKERGEEAGAMAEPFDSNCITPGTPFMERLAEHLRFFIRHKISEDPLWQVPTIVFSGHDVPGEGEHKVMEYIRWAKKSPEYEPNLRHCLYGLDADLIMLSLVTHEPHFCLLREVVSYKNKGQPIREALENPSEEHFVLFQIGLLRDYIQLEFEPYAKSLKFGFDIERIIDDFVLFCMLVGNDFLPPLPTCDINEGSLDLMFTTYKKLLPKMGGYLTHAGSLHRGRFELFLSELATFEAETLEQRANDAEEYESKKERRMNKNKPQEIDEAFGDSAVDSEVPEDFSALSLEGHELEILAAESDSAAEVDEKKPKDVEPTMMSKEARAFFEQGDKEQGLLAWKERYYREKLKCPTSDGRRKVVAAFLEGIHWVLEYYYRGVASWEWFYSYHYAPMVSDCVNLGEIEVKFVAGRPFLPFEQLMAVQPASSCNLLPEPYRHLMKDPNSPIVDFYPVDFHVDTEGKRAEWEGVVQVPFIDQDRLLRAIQSVPTGALTPAERKRNSAGSIIVFSHSPRAGEKTFCTSTLPSHLPDVVRCNSSAKARPAPPPLPKGEKGFQPALVQGTKVGISTIAGFPTLKTLAVYGRLEKAGVDVFGMRSRKESLILKFKNLTQGISEDLLTAQGISKAVLKQRAWVGWPYVKESIVEKVSDPLECISASGNKSTSNKWDIETASLQNEYMTKYGVDLGKIHLLVHVRPVEGLIRQVDGSIEKRFSKDTHVYPLQMTLRKNPSPDPRFDPKLLSKDDSVAWYDFKVGSKALFLGKAYYGCTATITHSGPFGKNASGKPLSDKTKDINKSRYRIILETMPETSAAIQASAKRLLPSMQTQYIPAFKVSRILGVSPKALGRITGNFWVRTGSGRNESIDIGLYVKDGKNSLVVPDFSASVESSDPNRKATWAYSNALISVLKSYKTKYPNVWAMLEEDKVTLENLFPGMEREAALKELTAIKSWLSSLPSAKRKLVKATSLVASEDGIRIFQASLPKQGNTPTTVEMESVSPALLLPPIEPGGLMAAFSGGSFALGDRVVSAGATGIPPFGIRGTVIGVHDKFLEVLFDTPFEGGTDLGGRCNGHHGAVVAPFALINLTRPHAISGESATIRKSAAAEPSPKRVPKIPDNPHAKGFGMGRGRGGLPKQVQPPSPQTLSGQDLLSKMKQATTPNPPPPPMPSSKLIQPQPAANNDKNAQTADAIWKLLGGKKSN
ncbi:hypothetical protein M9434_003812 [Picochlorum sp. BPE23]|nr:hypothetical protein M9434_003812 [Picochlorum sp. BPE23]